MNTYKVFFLLLLSVLSAACSKSDSNDTVAPTTTGVLTAQVDGQTFTATEPISTYDKKTKDLTVVGYNAAHQLGFTLEKFSSTGTIPLVDISTSGSTGSYIDVKTNTIYTLKEGRTGTVAVTRFDGNSIEGTFSMKTYNAQLKREVVISNGSFKLPVVNL